MSKLGRSEGLVSRCGHMMCCIGEWVSPTAAQIFGKKATDYPLPESNHDFSVFQVVTSHCTNVAIATVDTTARGFKRVDVTEGLSWLTY